MKMEVQIFMSDDNKALIYDNEQLDEFNSLVAELGLQCHNHIAPDRSPIPYLKLDESTIRAFKILCPRTDRIADYRSEIPLEILRNVKLSETEKYFDWLEVWSNEKDPDPFMVGRVYKDDNSRAQNYTWSAQSYLIGRWGAEAKPIQDLIQDAIHISSDRIKICAESTIAKMKAWKECPETWAKQYIYNNVGEAGAAINNGSPSIIF